jgi:hypothetical protein
MPGQQKHKIECLASRDGIEIAVEDIFKQAWLEDILGVDAQGNVHVDIRFEKKPDGTVQATIKPQKQQAGGD